MHTKTYQYAHQKCSCETWDKQKADRSMKDERWGRRSYAHLNMYIYNVYMYVFTPCVYVPVIYTPCVHVYLYAHNTCLHPEMLMYN